MAAIHFAEGFSLRYGHCHPMFFQGSLDDAMREAVMQPARNVSFFVHNLSLHFGSMSNSFFLLLSSFVILEETIGRLFAPRRFRVE